MSWLTRALKSGIGRKLGVGLTGLALVAFLVVHLLENLLIYAKPEGFNAYSRWLHGQSWLIVVELGLLLAFLIHIGLTVWLIMENRRARGDRRYAMSRTKQSTPLKYLASKWMPISGAIVLGFLVLHVADLRLAWDPAESGDLLPFMRSKIGVPWRATVYIVASLVVGWHLFHGFRSAFRSLGLNHPKYTPLIDGLGTLIALVFGLGFASFPIWFLL